MVEKRIVIIFLLLITTSIFTSETSAQNFKIIPESLFTLGDSNYVASNKHERINPPIIGVSSYRLKYGTRLYKEIENQSQNYIGLSNALNRDSLYFYKIFYYEGNSLLDSTNIDSSFQDGRPPKTSNVKIDTVEIDTNKINFIGKISQDNLQFDVSDQQYFYFFRHDTGFTEFYDLDSTYTGSGLSFLSLNDTELFNHPDSLDSHPVDTTFTVSNVLPNEGEHNFEITLKDAAFDPDQAKGILGNDTTYSYSVIYDTTDPKILLDSLKEVYSSPDIFADGAIKLVIVFTDTLAGIDTSSLDISTNLLDIVRKEWQKTDYNTSKLYLWIDSLQDTSDTLTVSISDRSGNKTEKEKVFRVQISSPDVYDFRVIDRDYLKDICLKPDSAYANEDSVRLDSFKLGNTIPDSLIITGLVDTTIAYADPIILPLSSLFPELESLNKYTISVAAKDTLGNIQTDSIPTHSIHYDITFPNSVQIIVSDTNTVDIDSLTGAFPGWTDSKIVNVLTSFTDSDLYKIQQISPDSACMDFVPEFLDTIPSELNKLRNFSYLLSDSAGNQSNLASYDIKLDTSIYQPKLTDFMVFDRSTGDSTMTDDTTSVYVKFIKPDSVYWQNVETDPKIFDLSRMIINQEVYEISADDTLEVPTGNGNFTISIVDSAGNKSEAIEKTIEIVKPFELASLLAYDRKDSAYKAASGWTNEDSIGILIVFAEDSYKNYEKIDSLYINGQAVEKDTIIADTLYSTYGPLTLGKNKLSAWVTGPIVGMHSNTVHDTIEYDTTEIIPNKITLEDTSTGSSTVTDKTTVFVFFDDNADNPYKIKISEDAPYDSSAAQNEEIKNYKSKIEYTLTNSTGIHTVFAAVIDSAGNQSVFKSDSIKYEPKKVALDSIVLKDTIPSAPIDTAVTGWTNDLMVNVKVHLIHEGADVTNIDTLQLARDSLFTIGKESKHRGDWQGLDDFTIETTYASLIAEPDDTLRNFVYCRVFGPQKNDTSNTVSNSIIADTLKPQLDSVSVSDFHSGSKNITGSGLIKIVFHPPLESDPFRYWVKISQDTTFEYASNKKDTTYADTVTFQIDGDPGLKKIFCAIRDSAGNWSEDSYNSIFYDSGAPFVVSIYPHNGACIHGDDENAITVIFSEWVQPQSASWQNSVELWDNYWHTSTPFDCVWLDACSLKVTPKDGILPPGQYRIFVLENSYADSAGNPGQAADSLFYVYVEPETGGTVKRKSAINDSRQVRVTIPAVVLPNPAVVFLDSSSLPTSPIPGSEGFEPVANTGWQVEVGSGSGQIYEQVAGDITIGYSTTDIQNSTEKELRILCSDLSSNIWRLLPCGVVNPDSNTIHFANLQDVNGRYCIAKQIGSNEDILSNYPNPFNAGTENTTIRFALEKNDVAAGNRKKIHIYDAFGNLVRIIEYPAKEGVNEVEWDGRNGEDQVVANGGYICVIDPEQKIIRKIAVLKR